MDDRERQRMEFKERNEKNKAWNKRLKYYYMGALLPWLLELLLFVAFMSSKSKSMIWVYVMVAVIVIWCLWVVFGSFLIRCPHCDAFLNRSAPLNLRCCPYCGTKMGVYPDLDSSKLQ